MIFRLIGVLTLIISLSSHAVQMGEKEFGDYIFGFLSTEYKQRKFKKSDDPLLIQYEETQLGLESLFKKLQESQLSRTDLDIVVKDHFDSIFSQLDMSDRYHDLKWNEAKKIIRPMFSSSDLSKKINVFSTKVDSNVISTFVLDNPKGYRYVTNEDIKKWDVSAKEVKENAENNLNIVSKGIRLQGNLDDVKFLIVQTDDGYDAARLLSPSFRDFLANKLGYPFYAGIPNRDFLIAWAKNTPEEVTNQFAKSIASDYRDKPNSLTPNILEVTKEGITTIE